MNSYIAVSHIPFPLSDLNKYALIVQPFHHQSLPLLNSKSISQCPKCESYIHSHLQTRCEICQVSLNCVQLLPDLSHTVHTELFKNYEMSQPQEVTLLPAMVCSYLFLIDLSSNSKDSTFLDTIINTIRTLIVSNSLPGGSRTRIGLIGFDTKLYFFDLSSYPVIYTVSEKLEDMFLPVPPQNLMVNLYSNYQNILYCLDILQNFSGDASSSYKILPRCLDAASRVLGCKYTLHNRGGKIMLFVCDPKRSKLKTNSRAEVMRNYAVRMKDARITCDLYVCGNSYCDLGGLSMVSRCTEGDIYYYPYMRRAKHANKLTNELKMNLTQDIGWDVTFRINISKGWKITQTYTNTYTVLDNCISLPIIKPSSTIAYEIQRISNTNTLSLQISLVYTTSTSDRRIRVLNFDMTIPTQISQYTFNPDILLNTYLKRAFHSSSLSPYSYIFDLSLQISSSLSSFPDKSSECLHNLLICLISLLNHPSFLSISSSSKLSADDISQDLCSFYNYRLEFCSVEGVRCMSYPRLIDLSSLDWDRYLPICRSSITENGVYLLDNGIDIFIWIGNYYLWKYFIT